MLILILNSFINFSNSYILNFFPPNDLFFIISLASFFVALGMSLYQKQFSYKISFVEVIAILSGNMIAPLFSLKGFYYSDLFTQTLIYSFYPIMVFLMERPVLIEKSSTTQKFFFCLYITFTIFIFIFRNYYYGLANIYGILYSLAAVSMLVLQKYIYISKINPTRQINKSQHVLLGFLLSSLLGFYLSHADINQQIFMLLNSYSAPSKITLLLIGLLAIAIPYIQNFKLKWIETNSVASNAFLFLLLPFISTLINNMFFFLDHRITFDIRLYHYHLITMILLVLFIKLKKTILLAFFSLIWLTGLGYYKIFDNNPQWLNYDKARIYSTGVDNSYKIHYELSNRYIITDGNPLRIGYTLETQNISSTQKFNFLIKGVMENTSIFVGINTHNKEKYIIKKITDDVELDNYKKLITIIHNFPFMLPFEILEGNIQGSKEYYILTPYLYGETFEEFFNQYNSDFAIKVDQSKFINTIILAAEYNLELIKQDFVHRDLHQRNILFSKGKMYIIDYDMIFQVSKIKNTVVDSFGFKHHLHDTYALFFPKSQYEATRNFKFHYLPHQPLHFSNNSEIINKNLSLIKNLIYDNSYFYSKHNCDFSKSNTIMATEKLITDLKILQNNKLIQNHLFHPEFNKQAIQNSKNCFHFSEFYNRQGKLSFVIYMLPSAVAKYNLIQLEAHFKEEDLALAENQNILQQLQRTGNHSYLIINKLSKSTSPDTKVKFEKFLSSAQNFKPFILTSPTNN